MENKPLRSRSETISERDSAAAAALNIDLVEGRASLDPQVLASRGIGANVQKVFAVPLRGGELYDLLRLLEEMAVEATDYLRVRAAVLFAEKIRERARGAGF